MSGEGHLAPGASAKIIDLVEAVATMHANAAVETAARAALDLIPLLDRHALALPNADAAAIMSAEAVGMLAANVALTAGRAVYATTGSEASAIARLRYILRHMATALAHHGPAVEAKLRGLIVDGAL